MKEPYPRVFPVWFLPFLVLVALLLMGQCGCKTGGKWIGGGSSGIKQIITPAELEQQPNGTYKIKPKKFEIPPGNPIPKNETNIKVESLPAPTKSAVRKPPVPPAPISAKAKNLLPAKIETAGSLTPFEPTITNIKLEEKVNVRPIKAPPTKLIEGDGGCVKNGTAEQKPKKDNVVSVQWLELFMFWFLGIMFLVFIWILYDIFREYKKVNSPKSKKAPTKKRGRPRKKSS